MTPIYLDPSTLPPIVRQVTDVAFPDYKGRKFRVSIATTVRPTSYWDGGSRSYWTFVRLADMATMDAPSLNPLRDPLDTEVRLTPGIVGVEHRIIQGKDFGLTFHICPEAATLLPLPTGTATDDEVIVLVATRSRKGSYGGVRNLRFVEAQRETGITQERYDAAKASCIEKKWLNAAGAITPNGRNIAGDTDLYQLRPAGLKSRFDFSAS